jgi:hypothetical protein
MQFPYCFSYCGNIFGHFGRFCRFTIRSSYPRIAKGIREFQDSYPTPVLSGVFEYLLDIQNTYTANALDFHSARFSASVNLKNVLPIVSGGGARMYCGAVEDDF